MQKLSTSFGSAWAGEVLDGPDAAQPRADVVQGRDHRRRARLRSVPKLATRVVGEEDGHPQDQVSGDGGGDPLVERLAVDPRRG